MLLDRLSGDEQPLCDLDVAQPLRRQLRGPQLAGGQGVNTGTKDASGPRTRRGQLLTSPAGDPVGAAGVGQLERPTQGLA